MTTTRRLRFEAFCAAVSNRSSTTEAVALSSGAALTSASRLQDLEEEIKLLCAFLKDAQLALTILRKGKGRALDPRASARRSAHSSV